MYNNYFPLTNNALLWLQIYFYDRLGINFNIALINDRIELSINGNESKLLFNNNNKNFYYPNSNLQFNLWDSKKENFESLFSRLIPAPGLNNGNYLLKNYIGNNIYFKYNIVGLIFWNLNRIEEFNNENYDSHNRFPGNASNAYLNNYLNRPIIDEWIYIFIQLVKELWPNVPIKKHNSKKMISCDVDLPFEIELNKMSFFKNIISLIKNKNNYDIIKKYIKNFYDLSISIENGDNYYNNIRWILDINEKYNNKVIFYFLSGSTHPLDPKYSLNNKLIRNIILEIISRGHDVGIHPSYMTYIDGKLMNKQVSNFNKSLKNLGLDLQQLKSRQHFLRWNSKLTPLILHESGITNDSTLGYADQIGFRCSTSHSYRMYDPVNDKLLGLYQSPLLLMETTVFDKRYLNLPYDFNTLSKVNDIKNKAMASGGSFNMLWHNSSFNDKNDKVFYIELIK